uniref:Uncharacterized protein n=1 Tax=Arundo donax TaxID=35708 RepID=A0A0A9A4J6_ARUDO
MTKGNLLSDKMNVDLNVLRTTVLNWIGRHVHSTNVVTLDNCGRLEGNMKFLKKLAHPPTLSNSVGNRTILGFYNGPGDRGLTLRGQGNQIITKINTEPRRRVSIVRTTSPVRVRIRSPSGH